MVLAFEVYQYGCMVVVICEVEVSKTKRVVVEKWNVVF